MIYFIAQGLDYVKIGYTASDPKARLISLQTGNPDKLELVKVIPGGRSIEAQLHTRFSIYHHKHEWYVYSVEIEWFISCANNDNVIQLQAHTRPLNAVYNDVMDTVHGVDPLTRVSSDIVY